LNPRHHILIGVFFLVYRATIYLCILVTLILAATLSACHVVTLYNGCPLYRSLFPDGRFRYVRWQLHNVKMVLR